MKRRTAAAASAVALLFLAGCSSSSDEATPTPTVTQTTPAPTPTTTTPGTIVDVASGNPDFSTLVTAVGAAGLAETLAGPGPFTVFAPTNEAFEALPDGVLDALLEPANKDALTKVLTYHVVPAEVMAADVKPGEVTTVEGAAITITTDGAVKVNDANVTTTDVAASNGVIHVIDAVLVPPDVDVAALTK